jgi:anti-sigma factor (TIGR02949 family)
MGAIDRYTCEQVFRRLDDFVDRELTPEEHGLVEQHLEVCVRCAAEYAFETRMLTEVRERVQRIAAPTGLLSRISDLLAAKQNGG